MAALFKRVLFVTPEMSDFVQCGGLGCRVLGPAAGPSGLELRRPRVLIPGYPQVLAKVRRRLKSSGTSDSRRGCRGCDVALTELA